MNEKEKEIGEFINYGYLIPLYSFNYKGKNYFMMKYTLEKEEGDLHRYACIFDGCDKGYFFESELDARINAMTKD